MGTVTGMSPEPTTLSLTYSVTVPGAPLPILKSGGPVFLMRQGFSFVRKRIRIDVGFSGPFAKPRLGRLDLGCVKIAELRHRERLANLGHPLLPGLVADQ